MGAVVPVTDTGDVPARRGRGRPRIGGRVTIHLGDELLAALTAEADAAGVDRSALIRTILGAAMNVGKNVGT